MLSAKFLAGENEVRQAVHLAAEAAHALVEPGDVVSGACRDTDDDHILACARAAKADYLVTGDSDLLELEEYEGISILAPRQFELLFAD